MRISVTKCEQYKFSLKIDGRVLKMSYKGFGGKKETQSIGDDAMCTMFSAVIKAVEEQSGLETIQAFFRTVGCANALLFFEKICANAFVEYWRNITAELNLVGKGSSFRSVLQFIAGGKATLAHYNPDSDLITRLKDICNTSMSASETNAEIRSIYAHSEYAPIDRDGITVRFLRTENNTCYFDVNGTEISACANRTQSSLNTDFIFGAAKEISDVIQHQNDLSHLTRKWGGSFVFRIAAAVCREDTHRYLSVLAEGLTAQRKKIEPRKILKEWNFSFNDEQNKPFTDHLLLILEQEKNKQMKYLVASNGQEVLDNEDAWILYDSDNGRLIWRKIEFTRIKFPKLQEEIRSYLRAQFTKGRNVGVTQLCRYFYSLRGAADVLGANGLLSFSDAAMSHARFLKSHMERTQHSANAISETLQTLGRMFFWLCHEEICDEEKINPFWMVDIPNKRNFICNTVPIEQAAMDCIRRHIEDLPEHIALAYQLLLATLARGEDVFQMPVSALRFVDGKYSLELLAGKNGGYINTEITVRLAKAIQAYADKTKELRDAYGKDILLVYKDNRYREGSVRKARIITPDSFRRHLNRLLEQHKDELPRDMRATARMIRAEGGRRYHAAGDSELEIATRLANLPQSAADSYNAQTPWDIAHKYNQVYNSVFSFFLNPDEQERNNDLPDLRKPLFGTCIADNCPNKKSCQVCLLRKDIERSDY